MFTTATTKTGVLGTKALRPKSTKEASEMVQGNKDRWDPNDTLSGEEKRRKQREIANVMRDVVADRYNPTTTSPSMYREEPRSGGGERYIGNIPARLVEASEKAAREHAEQVDRWTAFRDAQAREPGLTLEQWEARKEKKG
jgi:hypothetical protein